MFGPLNSSVMMRSGRFQDRQKFWMQMNLVRVRFNYFNSKKWLLILVCRDRNCTIYEQLSNKKNIDWNNNALKLNSWRFTMKNATRSYWICIRRVKSNSCYRSHRMSWRKWTSRNCLLCPSNRTAEHLLYALFDYFDFYFVVVHSFQHVVIRSHWWVLTNATLSTNVSQFLLAVSVFFKKSIRKLWEPFDHSFDFYIRKIGILYFWCLSDASFSVYFFRMRKKALSTRALAASQRWKNHH